MFLISNMEEIKYSYSYSYSYSYNIICEMFNSLVYATEYL